MQTGSLAPKALGSFHGAKAPSPKSPPSSSLPVRVIACCSSALFLLSSGLLGLQARDHSQVTSPSPQASEQAPGPMPSSPDARELVSKLPARIEENKGQGDPAFPYLGRARGYTAAFSEQGVAFSVAAYEPSSELEEAGPARGNAPRQARRGVLEMSFEGARGDPLLVPRSPQQGRTNYIKGQDPSRWVGDVKGYSSLYYEDLYEGVDLTFYDKAGLLAYDFVIAPGADPSSVRLGFAGQEKLEVRGDGSLAVSTPLGELIQTPPHAYQERGEEKVVVPSSFVVLDEKTVGFSFGDYDPALPLVVDPTLSWSSFLGGGSDDRALSLAVDSAGSAYVAAWTFSSDFPQGVLAGYDTSYGGGGDAFVARLSAGGDTLEWATYLGGGGGDLASAVAASPDGSLVYVVGETGSSDFPLCYAYDTTYEGGSEAFVTVLRPGLPPVCDLEGFGQLFYSTYLGGGGADQARGVAVVSPGVVLVTGNTSSSDFPTTQGAHDTSYNGGGTDLFFPIGDAFLAKLNTFASFQASLSYSTYLGGAGEDAGHSVQVGPSGAAYLAGETSSSDFPTTGGAYDTSHNGGFDAFATKFDPSLSTLSWSTYLGGSLRDRASSLAVDSAGAAYLAGQTVSSDYPTTQGAYDTSYNGGPSDAFVTKLSPDGSSLSWSSFLGGAASDSAQGIALDQAGSAHLVGTTSSGDFPTTQGALDASLGGFGDAFLAKFSPSGSSLAYSSYLGGGVYDEGTGIALDSSGAAYLTGYAGSPDFPTTAGAYDQSHNGNFDAFVTKVSSLPATISGIFTGGQYGAVAVFDATGALVTYECCIEDPAGSWEVVVPSEGTCPDSGYKVLFIPGTSEQRSSWYAGKPNWSTADCVPAPVSGVEMDVSGPGLIEGYVKQASDATDIDGAIVYAYTTTGAFAGWTKSGYAGPGRYRLQLDPAQSYKLYVVAPTATLEDSWWSAAPGFAEATSLAPPSTANFSLREAGIIQGQVVGPVPGAYVSVFHSCGCKTPRNGLTSLSGTYAIKVPTTAASGVQYKVRVIPPPDLGVTKWYSSSSPFGSTTFAGGSAIDSPASGIDVDTA